MKRTLTIAAMIALGAAASMPLPSIAQAGLSLIIHTAPPTPRFESVPAAQRGAVWAPGYWNWDGRRHSWLAGHWESARDGYQYRPGQWLRDGDGYRLRSGGWQPVAQSGYQTMLAAPPAPRYERLPRLRDGDIWQPGYWDWRANRYQWNPGSWIAERPGYDYARQNWGQHDQRRLMEAPRWSARERERMLDRMEHGRGHDHDGVLDRFERNGRHERDGDGVPNRYDRDRDGDGIRNDHDARPDNLRRH